MRPGQDPHKVTVEQRLVAIFDQTPYPDQRRLDQIEQLITAQAPYCRRAPVKKGESRPDFDLKKWLIGFSFVLFGTAAAAWWAVDRFLPGDYIENHEAQVGSPHVPAAQVNQAPQRANAEKASKQSGKQITQEKNPVIYQHDAF